MRGLRAKKSTTVSKYTTRPIYGWGIPLRAIKYPTKYTAYIGFCRQSFDFLKLRQKSGTVDHYGHIIRPDLGLPHVPASIQGKHTVCRRRVRHVRFEAEDQRPAPHNTYVIEVEADLVALFPCHDEGSI